MTDSISKDCRRNLEGLRFYVAEGRATAKMSRGSFSHRDRIRRRRELELMDIRENDKGLRFLLRDPLTRRVSQGSLERADTGRDDPLVFALRLSTKPLGTNRLWISLPAEPDEHFFGGGETFSHLDLRGNVVRVWVSEHQNTRIIGEKLIREKLLGPRPDFILPFRQYESYYSQPTIVSDRGYFIHMDGPLYMEADLTDPRRTVIFVRGDAVMYLGVSGSFEALSYGITRLTGIQPRMPERFLRGITLASQRGAADADRLISLAQEHDMPLTALWCQDWCGCRVTKFGYQVKWNWQYDRELYPDLPDKIKEWNSRGVAFLGYINPFLTTDGELWREAHDKGYLVLDRDGNDYMVTITTFPAAMIDFTNPEAYR